MPKEIDAKTSQRLSELAGRLLDFPDFALTVNDETVEGSDVRELAGSVLAQFEGPDESIDFDDETTGEDEDDDF